MTQILERAADIGLILNGLYSREGACRAGWFVREPWNHALDQGGTTHPIPVLPDFVKQLKVGVHGNLAGLCYHDRVCSVWRNEGVCSSRTGATVLVTSGVRTETGTTEVLDG
jgi:hypothetical protein